MYKEIAFEEEICEHLGSHGWVYVEGDASRYDRGRALFPDDVLAWVQTTQAPAWEALVKNHGSQAGETLLTRLRDSINQRGTLDVLRQGIEMLGVKGKLPLAQFKPALAINPEIQARYEQNRLRVLRQVRYSLHNENSIDLVLFLNGIPVATAELKTDFTQSVKDAIDQYRFDRDPKPKGKPVEPLLNWPAGALVHFAVSNSDVYMVTRLSGPSTAFLPFNKGDHGAAGNPVNTVGGHRTAYLWEEVWQKDSWLEILGRYFVGEKDDKRQLKAYLFPRYHQLDATRKLQSAVLEDGPGAKYLIQHSAGSGKTKTIAWTAHFFADLHDATHKKVFDTVLVVSDRNVIDGQLQDALFDFERTTGVVAKVTGEGGSKSGELAQALSGDKKIVVCTIQTFPFALSAVRELSAANGKKFAVIADEAHSSQAGEAAAKLKAVLSAEELKEIGDGGEVSMDDVLASQMQTRASDAGITFVAFTATPKTKTLELFGTRPEPSRPAEKENVPAPFHVYSMRQAIEEGFILDVLKNYTTYKLAFRLAHDGKEWDDKEVERSAAMKKIMGWVRLHPYNISQKVEIVVEHFREHVALLLGGKAKAMVVVSSRQEAVRWKLAIDKYIAAKKYAMRSLVAFSGEVKDAESGPDPFTENSPSLNPTLKGRDMREAFKGDEFQILLVANKFQTGFDQPPWFGSADFPSRRSAAQRDGADSLQQEIICGDWMIEVTAYVSGSLGDPPGAGESPIVLWGTGVHFLDPVERLKKGLKRKADHYDVDGPVILAVSPLGLGVDRDAIEAALYGPTWQFIKLDGSSTITRKGDGLWYKPNRAPKNGSFPAVLICEDVHPTTVGCPDPLLYHAPQTPFSVQGLLPRVSDARLNGVSVTYGTGAKGRDLLGIPAGWPHV